MKEKSNKINLQDIPALQSDKLLSTRKVTVYGVETV